MLQNNRIGIIFYDSLIIYSLYTFLEISRIIPLLLKNRKGNEGETQEAYNLKNFVELKNKDLVLWTLKIIFFYTLSGKNYKLYQTIDESNLIEYFYFDDIIEMENGNLIISSYQGIKLYTKTKDQYIFNYFYSFEYYIEKVLKIKSNRIIIFQIKQEIYDFLCADSFYKISIFNISNKSEKTLNTIKHHDLIDNFKFLIKGYNLFVIYDYGLEIYDIKKERKIYYRIYDEHQRNSSCRGRGRGGNYLSPRHDNLESDNYLKEFFCNYDDNYFIARNNEGIIELYKFEENVLKSYKELEFDKFQITGIKKLKNYNFLIYNENNIKILTIKK